MDSLSSSTGDERKPEPPGDATRSSVPAGSPVDPSIPGAAAFAAPSPCVSVIIPAFNAGRFIERTLESVLAQTYRNIEVLVVDDGSTDGTVDRVNSCAARDHRVRLLSQPHRGVSSARNLALAGSKGEFIALIDADDLWHKEKIACQVDCLVHAGPEVGLVYSWSRIIDEEDLPISEVSSDDRGDVLAALIYRNIVGNGSSPLIRRSCFDRVGMFDQRLSSSEDRDLYLRIAEQYEFELVPRYHVGYRRTQSGATAEYRKLAHAHALVMKEFQERHREIPRSLFRLSESHYCTYLSALSNEHGDYLTSFAYLARSVRLDAMRLLSSRFYLAMAKLCLRLIARPITGLIWEHQNSWRRVKLGARRLVDRTGPRALADSATESVYAPSWYDRIHHRRMARYRKSISRKAEQPA